MMTELKGDLFWENSSVVVYLKDREEDEASGEIDDLIQDHGEEIKGRTERKQKSALFKERISFMCNVIFQETNV